MAIEYSTRIYPFLCGLLSLLVTPLASIYATKRWDKAGRSTMTSTASIDSSPGGHAFSKHILIYTEYPKHVHCSDIHGTSLLLLDHYRQQRCTQCAPITIRLRSIQLTIASRNTSIAQHPRLTGGQSPTRTFSDRAISPEPRMEHGWDSPRKAR